MAFFEFPSLLRRKEKLAPPSWEAKEYSQKIKACIADPSTLDFKEVETSLGNIADVPYTGRIFNFSKPEEDHLSKKSEGFQTCMGFVISAEKKGTKPAKKISLVGHMMGSMFDLEYNQRHFQQRVGTFLNDAAPGTVDAVLFAGQIEKGDDKMKNLLIKDIYRRSVINIGSQLTKLVGFSPRVVGGPALYEEFTGKLGETRVLYDNNNRRLYIVRHQQQAEIVLELSELDAFLSDLDKHFSPAHSIV